MTIPWGTEEGSAGCMPTDTGIDLVTNAYPKFRIFRCGHGDCPAWGLRLVDEDGTVSSQTLQPTDPDLARAIVRLVDRTPELAPMKHSLWLKKLAEKDAA